MSSNIAFLDGVAGIMSTLPGVRAGVLDCADLVDFVGATQRAINQLAAAQSLAIARLAATEHIWDEHRGSVVERRMPLGYVREDAPGLISGQLGCSDRVAQTRVEVAAALAVRTPALLSVMFAGRLDQWRAQVAVAELEQADPAVAATVADSVIAHLGDTIAEMPAGPWRGCVRAFIERIDADAVTRRADRLRDNRYVRRFSPGPGIDEWNALIPAEDAALAWAAINTLAATYRREGLVETLEQGRADALVDLILARASVKVAVNLAVPVGAMALSDADGYVPVSGVTAASDGATHVAAAWLTDLIRQGTVSTAPRAVNDPPAQGDRRSAQSGADAAVSERSVTAHVGITECDPATGAPVTLSTAIGAGRVRRPQPSAFYRVPASLAEFVDSRDGGCRFPGCTAHAAVTDKDHVIAWPGGATEADNLLDECRRHHRVKQRPGWSVVLRPSGQAVWTAPTGHTRTSRPVDHLGPWRDPRGPSPGTTRAGPWTQASGTRGDRRVEYVNEGPDVPCDENTVPGAPAADADASAWWDDHGALPDVHLSGFGGDATLEDDRAAPRRDGAGRGQPVSRALSPAIGVTRAVPMEPVLSGADGDVPVATEPAVAAADQTQARAAADRAYREWVTGRCRPQGALERHLDRSWRAHVRATNRQPAPRRGSALGLVTDRYNESVSARAQPPTDVIAAGTQGPAVVYDPEPDPPPF